MKEGGKYLEHVILAAILLVVVGLLVAGLRILQLVTREVGANIALTQTALDAVMEVLKRIRQ